MSAAMKLTADERWCLICAAPRVVDDKGQCTSCVDHTCTRCGERDRILTELAPGGGPAGKESCRLCRKCMQR